MTRFLTLSFIILGLFLLPFFVTASVKEGNPILHLQFNDGTGDTATENIGGNDGNLGNKDGANPTWVDGPDARFGTALEFDGTTNFVEIPVDLSPQATDGAITIAAWVKVHATALDAHDQTRQPVVMKGNSGQWEYALYILDDFAVGFSVWNCGGSGVSEPSGGELTPDEWHYVAGSFEAGVGSKAYIYNETDGIMELVAEAEANDNEPCDGEANIFIAHREDGQFLNATIDEVRMWNEALSPEKIVSFAFVPVEPAGRLTATWGNIKKDAN
jgi:hypothetical protein